MQVGGRGGGGGPCVPDNKRVGADMHGAEGGGDRGPAARHAAHAALCPSAHLIFVMPLLVATTSTGAISDSSARLRKEKHSTSSMCTYGQGVGAWGKWTVMVG